MANGIRSKWNLVLVVLAFGLAPIGTLASQQGPPPAPTAQSDILSLAKKHHAQDNGKHHTPKHEKNGKVKHPRAKHGHDDKAKGKHGGEKHQITHDVTPLKVSKQKRRELENTMTSPPVGFSPDVTPTPEATPAPTLTKKERQTARQAASVTVTAAALAALPPAPAQDVRMIRYYGAADGGEGPGASIYYPWQFSNGFGKIEDKQRDVPSSSGIASHWVITDCGNFCGWDITNFIAGGGLATGDANWARFEVNRPTMVGYVHRDGGAPPAWLAQQGWVDSGIVDSKNTEKGWSGDPRHVYTKDFPAGMITIPGPGSGKILPWILFAEAGGARPTMPNGYMPNQTCTDDPSVTYKSRDGWPTWHPNHNLRSWCYYRRDHGTDPAVIFGPLTSANMPNYGQVAALAGMTENPWGFKGYGVTHWPEADYYIVMHFGTTGVGRFDTCKQRFHLVEVSAVNKAHTVLLYKIRFMADFGEVVGVAKGGDNPADDYSINPPGCPSGNADAAAEAQRLNFAPGVRREAIGAFFAPANEAGMAYGPWRFAKRYANTLGLTDAFVVNTQDALDSYDSASSLQMISQFDRSGTARFLTINQVTFGCPNLPATQRGADGYWYTDPFGLKVYDLNNRGADAVRQFCKPGWAGSPIRAAGTDQAAHLSGYAATRWGDGVVPSTGGIPGDFERSIQDAHGPNVNPILLYAEEMTR